MSSWGGQVYTELVNDVRSEFPEFRIVNKEASGWMRAMDFCLLVLSCGLTSGFMTRFVTTIGYTVFVPEGWADRDYLEKAKTIRHERVHMRQRKRMGSLRYSLTYLFWPLPVVFAAGRRDLEQEAYAETLRAEVEYYGPSALKDQELRAKIIKHFMSAQYFWMWPFRKSIEAWYDALVLKMDRELSGLQP